MYRLPVVHIRGSACRVLALHPPTKWVVSVGATRTVRVRDRGQLMIGVPGVARPGAPRHRSLALEIAFCVEDIGVRPIVLKSVRRVELRGHRTCASVPCGV